MAIFLMVSYFTEGGLLGQQERHQKEYTKILEKIRKRHEEARGEIGLRDEDFADDTVQNEEVNGESKKDR